MKLVKFVYRKSSIFWTMSAIIALVSSFYPNHSWGIQCTSLFSENHSEKLKIKQMGQPPHQVRTIFIPEAENLMPLIREQLKVAGYTGSIVIARHVDINRFEQVLKTGTDRDDSSEVWHWPHNSDASVEAHAKANLKPSQISYMNTIDISKIPALSVPMTKGSWNEGVEREKEYDQSNFYKNAPLKKPEYTKAFWAQYVVLIYRPDEAILNRAAEYEYWINGDARKALLLAIVVGENKESWEDYYNRHGFGERAESPF